MTSPLFESTRVAKKLATNRAVLTAEFLPLRQDSQWTHEARDLFSQCGAAIIHLGPIKELKDWTWDAIVAANPIDDQALETLLSSPDIDVVEVFPRQLSQALQARPASELGLRLYSVNEISQLDIKTASTLAWVHVGPDRKTYQRMCAGSPRHPFAMAAHKCGIDRSVRWMFSGRIKNPVEAERVLEHWHATFAGMGRAFYADFQILHRHRQEESWLPCTGCMACEEGPGCPLRPTQNLIATGEIVFDGASAQAMALAIAASQQDQTFKVFDRDQIAGGATRLRGRIPMRAEFWEAARFLQQHMDSLELWADDHELPSAKVIDTRRRFLQARKTHWGQVTSAEHLLLISTLDPGPFIVVGDTLLAAEMLLWISMKSRPAIHVSNGKKLAFDGAGCWQNEASIHVEEKGIQSLQRHDLQFDDTELQLEGRKLDHAVVIVVDEEVDATDPWDGRRQRDRLRSLEEEINDPGFRTP